MFPDIRSMNYSQPGKISTFGWIMLFLLVGGLVAAIHLFSMMKLSEYGLLPEVNNFGVTHPLLRQTDLSPQAPVIPVTGGGFSTLDKPIYLDSFTSGIEDWTAHEGAIHRGDEFMTLSPGWFGFGGIAAWNIPNQMLPESFAFSARINTDAEFGQVYGLGINLNAGLKETFFVLNPALKSAAILQREKGTTSVLSTWQVSDAVLPYPDTNLLTVECSADGLRFLVNGSPVVSIDYTQPCSVGQVGVFVRTPGWMIRVTEADLYDLR